MASIVGASNALEARLAELAGFGLGRPANVLFSEYVKVLVAREVIDAATAARLSAGFYAAHYGDPNGENPDVAEAIERLEAVINRLAAMPVEARVELSERVQRELRSPLENGTRAATTNVRIAPETAREAPPPTVAGELWNAERQSGDFDDDGPFLSVAVAPPESDANLRRGSRLTLLVFAAVAIFFAGYASFSPIEKYIARNRTDAIPTQSTQERPKVVDQQPAKETLLRSWAVSEGRMQQDHKASLAYELLLAYQPEDALTLNNLAWLYLTTEDPSVHNPQRGFELAEHAINLRRSAEFLDTAAEAHYQIGKPQEAVTLEKEALEEAQADGPFRRGLVATLRQQLEKFEAACKPQPASPPKRSHTPTRTTAPIGLLRGI